MSTVIIDGKVVECNVNITLPTTGGTTDGTPPVVTPTPPPTPPPVPVGVPGSKTNPIKLITYVPGVVGYGFHRMYASEYVILKGRSSWFKIDPTLINGPVAKNLKIYMLNYDPYETNMKGKLYSVSRSIGIEKLEGEFGEGGSNFQVMRSFRNYNPDIYYLVELQEIGKEDQPMSIWWSPF